MITREEFAKFIDCAEDIRVKVAEELQNPELPQADYLKMKNIYRCAGDLYVQLNRFRLYKEKEKRDD